MGEREDWWEDGQKAKKPVRRCMGAIAHGCAPIMVGA